MESSKRSRGFIVAVLVFVAGLGVVAVRLFPVSSRDLPELYVAHEQLCLGRIVAQSGYKHVMTIRNTSDKHLTISRFVSSCTCAHTIPSHVELEPGESCDVELTLELMRFLKLDRMSVIPVTVRISPVVNSVTWRPWTLEAEVTRPPVYSLSKEIDMGRVSPDAEQVDSLETVYVSEDVEPAEGEISMRSVAAVQLVPIADARTGGCPEGYREYRIRLMLAKDERPYGVMSRPLSIHGAGSAAHLLLPCHLRFDSGLRAMVDRMPARVVQREEPIEWTVSVLGTRTPFDHVELRGTVSDDGGAVEIVDEAAEDGVWRFRCKMVPKRSGDIVVLLTAHAELKGGSSDSCDLSMRFFALELAEDKGG